MQPLLDDLWLGESACAHFLLLPPPPHLDATRPHRAGTQKTAASGRTESEMKRAQDAARGELMFQALAVLAVCLSAFNLYLLGWLWWGAGGGTWAQLELLSHWRQLKFKGLVVSSGLLRAAQVSGRPEVDAEQSAHKLRINATRLHLQPLETTANSKHSNSSSSNKQQPILLSLIDGRVNFSSGLLVEGAFRCPASPHRPPWHNLPGTCVITAPHLRLSQPQPLDAGHKSLQLTRLQLYRLHAPIGQLKLLASAGLHFRSAGQLRVEALERLSLSGPNVILNSSYVDVSSLKRAAPGAEARYYQLCVCLAPRRQPPGASSGERNRSQPQTTRAEHKKSGLLFGVPVDRACGDFGAVCMAGPT